MVKRHTSVTVVRREGVRGQNGFHWEKVFICRVYTTDGGTAEKAMVKRFLAQRDAGVGARHHRRPAFLGGAGLDGKKKLVDGLEKYSRRTRIGGKLGEKAAAYHLKV